MITISHLKNQFENLSTAKKTLLISASLFALAILITGIVLLIYFLTKKTDKSNSKTQNDITTLQKSSPTNSNSSSTSSPTSSPANSDPKNTTNVTKGPVKIDESLIRTKYINMGYDDAFYNQPKQILNIAPYASEVNPQIYYDEGWNKFMAYWDLNQTKIENETKLEGIKFAILGLDGLIDQRPIRYQKPFADGYYMSDNDIIKEAFSGNLDQLPAGYTNVYIGSSIMISPKGFIGILIKNAYVYGKNDGQGVSADPLYRVDGILRYDESHTERVKRLQKIAYDSGFENWANPDPF